MKILIVDDSPVNQLVTGSIIESLGIAYAVADNGLLALEALKNDLGNEIMFILMDCHMPELDGYRATKFIRRGYCGDATKGIPIVALTGSSDESDVQTCIEAGMNGFLTKPVDKEQLSKILKKFRTHPAPDAL
jgi:CheY-like chemotaxis protein